MTVPKKLRQLVFDRDDRRCVVNGPTCMHVADDPHHRANRGMGSSKVLDDPRNVIAACRSCNSRVEDSTGAEREQFVRDGHHVPQAGTNAKSLIAAANKAVKYPDGGLWFLFADGTRKECTPPDF